MIIFENEDLSKHTTIKIGGTARRFLIPENRKELIEVINSEHPFYFIGGGSNLLINDRVFDLVVSLKMFDTSICLESDGVYRVGASARLQMLIKRINDDGFGGIEYLCNVPGLVGGAVAMNAGTGKKRNKSISDYIISVEVIKDGKIVTLEREECEFSYRDSFFKRHADAIVASVLFRFPPISLEESSRAKEEKMKYYKEKQDPSYPNFGSVFREANYYILLVVKKLKIGGKVHFSGKTVNWMLNDKHGTYRDAVTAIRKVEILHKLMGQKSVREVITWE